MIKAAQSTESFVFEAAAVEEAVVVEVEFGCSRAAVGGASGGGGGGGGEEKQKKQKVVVALVRLLTVTCPNTEDWLTEDEMAITSRSKRTNHDKRRD
ncbi:hypothetical protein TYRP_004479 [Tyrophagus putrescentiae]|nr:hypothetical protein TYRP_004479 [Tyrophagus putrescentiae]